MLHQVDDRPKQTWRGVSSSSVVHPVWSFRVVMNVAGQGWSSPSRA